MVGGLYPDCSEASVAELLILDHFCFLPNNHDKQSVDDFHTYQNFLVKLVLRCHVHFIFLSLINVWLDPFTHYLIDKKIRRITKEIDCFSDLSRMPFLKPYSETTDK